MTPSGELLVRTATCRSKRRRLSPRRVRSSPHPLPPRHWKLRPRDRWSLRRPGSKIDERASGVPCAQTSLTWGTPKARPVDREREYGPVEVNYRSEAEERLSRSGQGHRGLARAQATYAHRG